MKALTIHLDAADSVFFQLLTEIARKISLDSIGYQVIKVGTSRSDPLPLLWFAHAVIHIGGVVNAADVIQSIPEVFASHSDEMRKAARKIIRKFVSVYDFSSVIDN